MTAHDPAEASADRSSTPPVCADTAEKSRDFCAPAECRAQTEAEWIGEQVLAHRARIEQLTALREGLKERTRALYREIDVLGEEITNTHRALGDVIGLR